MTEQPEVLIVGAGPIGLVLALELAYYGVPFRIIDKAKGPGETSRAMLVIPRVLEGYRKFGLDEKAIAQGIRPQKIFYRVDPDSKGTIPLAKIGKGESAHSSLLVYPQDEHEKLLIEELNEYGVQIEWETELVSIQEKGEEVEAELKKESGHQTDSFSYVIGCDGASSIVRKQAGINFEGETYPQVFYVMDVMAEGEVVHPETVSFSFVEDQFSLFFPLRNKKTTRMIGMFPSDLTEKEDFSYESLKPRLEKTYEINILEKNWFSDYKVHRRIASRFQKRRVFLAGDAAHIHSPVGGQGMNAGIGDAVNLGWKLASVIQNKAEKSLLNTYEQERKAFAEWLVSSTDRIFKQIAATDKWKQRVRNESLPILTGFLSQSSFLRKRLYIVLSQLYVSYKNSELSEGKAGKIKAGDRLPYADGERFEFMRETNWQLHVFKEMDDELKTFIHQKPITLVKRKWTDKTKKAHFKEDAAYLVRPDGHIGWAGLRADKESLSRYIDKQFK